MVVTSPNGTPCARGSSGPTSRFGSASIDARPEISWPRRGRETVMTEADRRPGTTGTKAKSGGCAAAWSAMPPPAKSFGEGHNPWRNPNQVG